MFKTFAPFLIFFGSKAFFITPNHDLKLIFQLHNHTSPSFFQCLNIDAAKKGQSPGKKPTKLLLFPSRKMATLACVKATELSTLSISGILMAREHLLYLKFQISRATTESDREENSSTTALPKLDSQGIKIYQGGRNRSENIYLNTFCYEEKNLKAANYETLQNEESGRIYQTRNR